MGKHEEKKEGDGKWEGPVPPAQDPGGGGGKHGGGGGGKGGSGGKEK